MDRKDAIYVYFGFDGLYVNTQNRRVKKAKNIKAIDYHY